MPNTTKNKPATITIIRLNQTGGHGKPNLGNLIVSSTAKRLQMMHINPNTDRRSAKTDLMFRV